MPKSKRGRPLSSNWKPTQSVVVALGISDDHLFKLKSDGILKQGHHWRNISPAAARPTYRWHLPKIEAVLNGEE